MEYNSGFKGLNDPVLNVLRSYWHFTATYLIPNSQTREAKVLEVDVGVLRAQEA